MDPVIEKVCAFITREGAAGKELLVFEHVGMPEAGVQIPAGTVELGEPEKTALLREIREEAGLTQLRIVNYLGRLDVDLPTGNYAMNRPAELLQGPQADAAPVELPDGRGTRLNRGWYVDVLEEHANWVRVAFTEGRQSVSGWTRRELLAARLARHLYHLIPLEAVAEHWDIFAEDRYTFRYSWLPLRPRPHLAPPQDGWLSHLYERLV